ncbi:threonine-phosphate decarboxylase CobD [Litorisediminicola beolgyonensis]|uniref:threonine-phosphate decarboxylase n=1 Tax=Litorisediminicola beolgyonensis TaxID=1173614 RepID=A0ABW3ZG49_9RHOB
MEHGGNLDGAAARFGGDLADWLDLSTGINPRPYPIPPLPPRAFTALPTRSDMAGLEDAARAAYATDASVVPLAGAQGAIQLLPRVLPRGRARVLGPTYGEHAAACAGAGWRTETVATLDALDGADLAVVVNPNNPDGRRHAPEALIALAERVGLLVVDESFADAEPELSVAAQVSDRMVVERSFGKFYGLAGLRLGMLLARPDLARALRDAAGPWPVSGPAIAVGCAALRDEGWQEDTRGWLARSAARLDALTLERGWDLVGGTTLFRTYAVGDARAEQARLARAHIWTRAFDHSPGWLRLGLPPEDGWTRLEAALVPD